MSRYQESLSQDTVFELLSSPRRRFILYYVRQHGGEATIEELTTEIASWENNAPPEELTRQDEKRVYVSLYQTHIPKLEEEGVIEYDSEEGIVRLTDRSEEFDQYLGTGEPTGPPWQLAYITLAVVGGLLFAAAVFDVWVLAAIPSALIGGALTLAILTLAVIQFAYERYRRDRADDDFDMDGA